MIDAKFYDFIMTERDQAWAEQYFGTQDAHQPDGYPVARLSELRAAQGDSERLLVMVRNARGEPAPGIVIRMSPRDVAGEVMDATTDHDGIAEFAMTDAHRFYVPGQGHYAVGIPDAHCDVYNSAGWVAGAHRWFSLVYQVIAEEPEPTPEEGTVEYYLQGYDEAVTRDQWCALFNDSFAPVQREGANDFDVRADIAKLTEVHGMELRCRLVMPDGSIPPDIDQYQFCIDIYENDFRADFKLDKIPGEAVAGWGMGHEGWSFVVGDGRGDVGLCYVKRKDGELLSNAVKGIGWFDDHIHADFEFVLVPVGEPDTYTLTVEIEGLGSVSVNPLKDEYQEGEAVTLTALAADGHAFIDWTIGPGFVTRQNPLTLVMDADKVLTAAFAEDVPPPTPGPTPEDIEAAKQQGHIAHDAIHEAMAHLGVELP